MQRRIFKTVIVLLTLISMTAMPLRAMAGDAVVKENRRLFTVFDLVVVRPVGFAMFVGGAGLFLATLPVTAIAHENDRAGDILIKEPARIAFGRR